MVLVVTKKGEFKGILMQRPEIVKGNFIILKLDSGYNIGISKKNIKKIKLLKKAKKKKEKKIKIKRKENLPNISILSTGGTISCKVDYETGGVYPALSAEDFVRNVPEILEYANIDARQILKIPSEDFMPEHWVKIAKECYKEIKKGVNGIIVTHGTDTLHFTSAALSFMIRNLPIPIVLTASQRSIDRGSSDAFPNLLSSVIAASKWDGAEVVICMHENLNDEWNFLLRGTKVRKMHSERRDAFRPINNLPLARVRYDGKIEKISEYRKRENVEPILETKIDDKVALIYMYPGITPDIIEYYIKKKIHGIVIAGTGFGHTPTSLRKNSFISILKKCYQKNIPVVMTSQCLYGRTHKYVYTPLRKLSIKANVIFGEDMLPEVAYVKLMWVLGKTKDIDEIRNMMTRNYVGEICERSELNTYLK